MDAFFRATSRPNFGGGGGGGPGGGGPGGGGPGGGLGGVAKGRSRAPPARKTKFLRPHFENLRAGLTALKRTAGIKTQVEDLVALLDKFYERTRNIEKASIDFAEPWCIDRFGLLAHPRGGLPFSEKQRASLLVRFPRAHTEAHTGATGPQAKKKKRAARG